MAVHYAKSPGEAPTVVKFTMSKQQMVGDAVDLAIEVRFVLTQQ